MADRKFVSSTGEPIRVTMPDGRIAIVGTTPTELHSDLHREAMKAGCIPSDTSLPPPVIEQTLDEKIQDAMIFAYTSDDASVRDEAFSSSGLPQVRWIERHIGLSITADQRNAAWEVVKPQLKLADS